MIYLKIYLLIGVVVVVREIYRDIKKGIPFTLGDLVETPFLIMSWVIIPITVFYNSHWANKVLIRGRWSK